MNIKPNTLYQAAQAPNMNWAVYANNQSQLWIVYPGKTSARPIQYRGHVESLRSLSGNLSIAAQISYGEYLRRHFNLEYSDE